MPVVVVPKSVVWIRPTLPLPLQPTPDPSDREKENARHLQLNICSRLFYRIKYICFILTRLKELYFWQPRLQVLFVFQHGGDRREDPGTQRTKTIADWWFSHGDFDWLNLQKQKWWLLAGSSQPCPQGLFLLQWGRGCMAVFCHPVVPPSVWSACKRVQKAGDVCTQAAFHSANMPISRWPPLALYTTELTSAHRRRTAWSENSRHLYSASDEVSLVFRAFLIPLQWKGQSGSWPKVSQSLGTRLLPGLCVHCRQVESSLLGFKKEVQTGSLRS